MQIYYWASACEKQSQLLPGTLCKQQKLKLPQADQCYTFPNAYSQRDSPEETCRSQFSFFS